MTGLLVRLAVVLLLISSCKGESNEPREYDVTRINNVLSYVVEDDPKFVEKGISFDSTVTMAGTRQYRNKTQRVKMKLFYFGDYTRGYYNLADQDNSNLQVFGRKVGDQWALKCVTKINMEEAGGYLILPPGGEGIWSSGHLNFEKQDISLTKQNVDYTVLDKW